MVLFCYGLLQFEGAVHLLNHFNIYHLKQPSKSGLNIILSFYSVPYVWTSISPVHAFLFFYLSLFCVQGESFASSFFLVSF